MNALPQSQPRRGRSAAEVPGSPAAPCQLLSLHPAGAGCYKAARHAARRRRRAFVRVPQAQHPRKHTPRPLLFAVPRTQRALGADAAAPGLHHGPQGDAGLASVKSATFPPLLNQKTRQGEARGKHILLGEGSPGDARPRAQAGSGRGTRKKNLRHLKLVLKCNTNVLNPL